MASIGFVFRSQDPAPSGFGSFARLVAGRRHRPAGRGVLDRWEKSWQTQTGFMLPPFDSPVKAFLEANNIGYIDQLRKTPRNCL
jgi:hypothetical protein